MKNFFCSFAIVMIVVMFVVSCSAGNDDSQYEVVKFSFDEQEETFMEEESMDSVYTYLSPRDDTIRYFDSDNCSPYWVARWNTPSFFSQDGQYDGHSWDGNFFQGTKVDSLVYFLFEDRSGRMLEKYFYEDKLCRDPRASAWWQSTIFDIYRNDDIEDIETAIRECCCMRDSLSLNEQIVSNIVKEMEDLGFWKSEASNSTFDMGIALLRYTQRYCGKNLSYEEAARLIHG